MRTTLAALLVVAALAVPRTAGADSVGDAGAAEAGPVPDTWCGGLKLKLALLDYAKYMREKAQVRLQDADGWIAYVRADIARQKSDPSGIDLRRMRTTEESLQKAIAARQPLAADFADRDREVREQYAELTEFRAKCNGTKP